MVRKAAILASSVATMCASAGLGADLDRWQLHEMAAVSLEVDPSFFSASKPVEIAPRGDLPAVHREQVMEERSIKTPPDRTPAETRDSPPNTVPSRPKLSFLPSRRKEPTLECLREEAHRLAKKGLDYKFGSDDPDEGGLDCSGAVQHLLSSLGIRGVPRTSYLQYEWLKESGTLNEVSGKNSTRKLLRRLSPGDLIFWGGTWKSGHKVSHVMIYMGYNPNNGTHYVFGARGKRTEGLLGAGVDVFVLNPDRGTLVAHGKVPGLRI